MFIPLKTVESSVESSIASRRGTSAAAHQVKELQMVHIANVRGVAGDACRERLQQYVAGGLDLTLRQVCGSPM